MFREGVFIPAENSAEMSLQQSSAVAFINRELSDGELKSPADRTPEKVRQVLDEAFGTDMAAAELVAQSAEQTQVGTSSQGLPVSLHDSLDTASSEAWREVNFPRIWGETRRVDRATEKARRALWARVFHALNDHKPVVIDVMIDFNGLDASDGTFKGALLLTNGKGHQGGHLTVLDDYTVTDVPGLGRIGRGEVSAELKTKALQGRIETLVAKNSWGVNRPERGIKDGITIFERDYLEKQFPWKQDDSDPNSPVYWYTSLGGFLLPPGY
ncbi:MAG: hypothetical protein NTX25_22190 [Proteobacteria bacterium]|nr:hypothetical protein [Pseudomonadota bacterium]